MLVMNKWTHVLLVEDDLSLGETIKELLELNYYRVTWFQNGLDALSFLTTELVDVIVTDVIMPVMNGQELRKEMELYHISTKTPIVFITALRLEDLEPNIVENFQVLTKPFSVKVLLEKIKEVIQNKMIETPALPSDLTTEEETFRQNLIYWTEVYYKDHDIITLLTNQLGVSVYELERRVLDLMHVNLRTYLLNYRIKKSLELIHSGYLNVTEISKKCGFKSMTKFSEVFKKMVGTTPKKYILKNQD